MLKLTSFFLAGLLALCVALPAQAKQVPFKAISDPDFSKIVTIHVPEGWKHRNAEGMMELTPPKGEGYVCVAVSNLDGRTPQQMATLLAEGKTPGKCPGLEDAWQWTTDPTFGVRSNFFVGSARDDVYVHFSWRDVDESAIKAILANSVMAGAQVKPAATGAKGDASPNRVGGNASADVGDAICRVVVTGADASVMDKPSPKGNVRFKASAPAEYIATRYTTVCAGSECDGSVWYELPGAFDWDGEKIAPSLAGRSAKGALLHTSLYISAKSVREIPLREGDAEAVSEMLARKSENGHEPQETAIDKITTALVKYAGKSVLEAKALRGEAAVIGLLDSDDDEQFAHVQDVYTDTFLARYFDDIPTSVYRAEIGANIGGIVLGTSTMADVRKILGGMGDEHAVDEDEKDGFTFKKYNLAGGSPIYDDDAPVDRRIPFKAAKKLAIEWIRGEGMGESVKVYFDEGGRAVAIVKNSIGVR